MAALLFVWFDSAIQLRASGTDLFGRTVLGWRRIDLTSLCSAAVSGRLASVMLRDRQGAIRFPMQLLEPVADVVRQALVEAEQQGRLVVPIELAQVLGLPVQGGAAKRELSIVPWRTLIILGLALGGVGLGYVTANPF